MDGQNIDFGPIAELQRLGEGAQTYFWAQSEDEKREKERAVNEFVTYFESIPNKVELSPSLATENFCANLMIKAIKYGRIDEEPQTYISRGGPFAHVHGERKVLLTAGRVFSQIGNNYPVTKQPALNYLNSKVRGGWRWQKHSDSEAHMKREDALELLGWACVGIPGWVKPDLVRLAIEGAILPYCTDRVLIDNILFDMKKENCREPEDLVLEHSEKAIEALRTMLTLNPDLIDNAALTADRVQRTAERMIFDKKITPLVIEATEQVQETIFDVMKEKLIPKEVVIKIQPSSSTGDLKL